MSFPPLHPPTSKSTTSSNPLQTSNIAQRNRQSPWGLPQQSSASRGLTPLATNLGPASTDSTVRRPGASFSPVNTLQSASASTPSFSSVLNSSGRGILNRNHPSSTTTSSPYSANQPGSQQSLPGSGLASPRSQANTPSSNHTFASSAATSTAASQVGGGGSSGGGGGSRPATFSPSFSQPSLASPTATSFDRAAFAPAHSSPSSTSQSSVSKIVVTQVFILLGSITEKEGKQKWESQAEAIRKLVYSNGMEVFAKYLRRLIQVNSSVIFGAGSKNGEPPGNYPLLVKEMDKIIQDPEQAKRIADVIDTSEGDLFKDFDLSTFMDHFRLSAIGKALLASAFIHVQRQDLQTKGISVLLSNYQTLLTSFANLGPEDENLPTSLLASAAFFLLRDLPTSSRDGSESEEVYRAFQTRYARQAVMVPALIRSAICLAELMVSKAEVDLLKELQSMGPSVTRSIESAKDFLRERGSGLIDENQVSAAIIFMLLTPDSEQYNLKPFITSVQDVIGLSFDWNLVVRGFDRGGLSISSNQFLALYEALLPCVTETSGFDVQTLWGGNWRNRSTQLSFALAFLSQPSSILDASQIPNLRIAYDPEVCADGPREVMDLIDEARKDTAISLDAVTAILDIFCDVDNPPSIEENTLTSEIIQSKLAFFTCSAVCIKKPWTQKQQTIMSQLVSSFLLKQSPNYSFVLHLAWKQDKTWIATEMMRKHYEDPLTLIVLFEHAQEHGWLDELCSYISGFAMDIAAWADRKDAIDLNEWAQDKLSRDPGNFVVSITKLLAIKAEDEMRTQREEQAAPRTATLAIKTVSTLVEILEKEASGNLEVTAIIRQCVQAFPRLINYGEGFDDILENNALTGHAVSQQTDSEMQELYKQLYGGELEVRDFIDVLDDRKTSRDPGKQDLFCCIIHGLFDEFVCFNEYPLAPLAITAVFFGGIISYRLVNNLTLRVALSMVLEAVRYEPDQAMYKFGLQALLNFRNRLHELPEFARQLLEVRSLQSTEVYGQIQEIVNNNVHLADQSVNAVNGTVDGNTLMNGVAEDEMSGGPHLPEFRSVHAGDEMEDEAFDDPDESVQDKVLFNLNNVTEENLREKFQDINGALDQTGYFRWFASQLVDQRAKLQPNYQQLYLDLIGLFSDATLWAEVIRTTYRAVQRGLNSKTVMSSTSERTHLRNLGSWLGSLTIARDKPIKDKYVSFKNLLLEGWESDRLMIVIPFTCAVLVQGTKSTVYKPPNPWLMDIIALLLEFHDRSDTKAFAISAIETMLNAFGFPRDGKGMERSDELQRFAEFYDTSAIEPEGINGFNELTIGGLNKVLPNAKFSPAAIAEALPSLEGRLNFPPLVGTAAQQRRIRSAVEMAVSHAIEEIAQPVVERSIAIATIATRALVTKDFARESDEDKVRQAAQNMGRTLAGSLALVTSKEPLKMSMSNHIRLAQMELADQQLPEGSILMMVNDNLDVACALLEQLAEENAVNEIDKSIEADMADRRQHKIEFPSEPYRSAIYNPWSSYIPDPFKQGDGVGQEQIDIYLSFARQSRGPPNHIQSASTDSGRQIPDVLQEVFPPVPSLTSMITPADTTALSHQAIQNPHSRMLPTSISSAPGFPNHMNGFGGFDDITIAKNHILARLAEIKGLTSEASEARLTELKRDGPILTIVNQIQQIAMSSAQQDDAAMITAHSICSGMYVNHYDPLELDVLMHLLNRLCQISPITAKEVSLHLGNQEAERFLNIPVTISLLENGLIDFGSVDVKIARQIHQQKPLALEALAALLDSFLFTDSPLALRADFASSLAALGQRLEQQPDLALATEIQNRLRAAGVPKDPELALNAAYNARHEQIQYVFAEWLGLYSHPAPTESMYTAFILQVHQQSLLESQHDMVSFFRVCIEGSIDALNQNDFGLGANPVDAYLAIDGLARFIVQLVKNQGLSGHESSSSKTAYMKSILSLIVLILNNHHVLRGEQFSQRAYCRLFTTVFYDWAEFGTAGTLQDKDMALVFAQIILLLGPHHFPGFTYGWLELMSHRTFMPAILRLSDDQGCEPYVKIVQCMLAYIGRILEPGSTSAVAKDLYRGALRVLLILHHDYPEFLAENHYKLCNVIPAHATQLRNVILSAYPSSFPELPDPFTVGLKVDRLEEIRNPPVIACDVSVPLQDKKVKDAIDNALQNPSVIDDLLPRLLSAIQIPSEDGDFDTDVSLVHALVLYLGQSATMSYRGGPAFVPESPQAVLMTKLTKELSPERRYHFLSAVVNQLRYPNSHTHYFCYALLHLFGNDFADQQESDIRQQITRVLLERLIVHRPHPWGLIITLLELLKNPSYSFWDLPFIKAAPE
ncbi:hypothetical protein MMC25_001125, partial [Agyrium rufum]|nr:hypothetical protein [Agyrium rufum]